MGLLVLALGLGDGSLGAGTPTDPLAAVLLLLALLPGHNVLRQAAFHEAVVMNCAAAAEAFAKSSGGLGSEIPLATGNCASLAGCAAREHGSATSLLPGCTVVTIISMVGKAAILPPNETS